MIETAMILAAGRGERMRPLTDTIPKPLLPVAGRSMLDRSMDRLEAYGVRKIVVNAHYLGSQIARHLAGRATVLHEEQLLDSGGGIKNALGLLGRDAFFVVNGDGLWRDGPTSILSRLEAAWDPERMDALLLLHPIDRMFGREARDRGDYFLDTDGRIRHRGDAALAPHLYASLYVCDRRLFDGTPDGAFSVVPLWHRAQAKGRLFGLVNDGDWFHIGTPQALAEAEKALA